MTSKKKERGDGRVHLDLYPVDVGIIWKGLCNEYYKTASVDREGNAFASKFGMERLDDVKSQLVRQKERLPSVDLDSIQKEAFAERAMSNPISEGFKEPISTVKERPQKDVSHWSEEMKALVAKARETNKSFDKIEGDIQSMADPLTQVSTISLAIESGMNLKSWDNVAEAYVMLEDLLLQLTRTTKS